MDNREIPVLNGINLSLPAGRITVILGQSGCGKNDASASDRRTGDGGQRRDPLGERPQDGICLSGTAPHAVVDRLGKCGVRAFKKETDPGKIEAVIRTVGLSGFEKAYPAQLSGGMQQRAAIARALAYEPTFIMMDEPFAALDYFTREQMQKELLRVQQERSASILFVTHSIDEALILGSQIAVIEKGMVKALYEVKAPQEERNLLEEEMITLKRDIINNLHFI